MQHETKTQKEMTQQLFVWSSVVSIMLTLFVFRGMKRLCARYHIVRYLHRLVHSVSDREMFYCPGDIADEEEL